MKKTLYDILGVPAAASAEDIHAAWLRIEEALGNPELPPDPDREIRRTAAREAFQVLSDENRRSVYDASLRPPAPNFIGDEASPFAAARKNGLVLVLGVVGIFVLAPIGYFHTMGYIAQQRAIEKQAEIIKLEREMAEGTEEERIRAAEVRERWQQEEDARRARNAAERAEYERERERNAARWEADRTSQALDRAADEARYREAREAERLRREAERTKREAEREAERQRMAAQRQLERDKAYLEKLQQDNRRLKLEE